MTDIIKNRVLFSTQTGIAHGIVGLLIHLTSDSGKIGFDVLCKFLKLIQKIDRRGKGKNNCSALFICGSLG